MFMNESVLEERKKRGEIISKELKKLFPNYKVALDFSNPWELLVAVVLAAQCTDKLVNKVTANLFKKYKKIDDYARADLEEFQNDTSSVTFFRNKAKNILSSAKIIKEKYKGKVPQKMDELVELPGIGRKSANVILGCGYGIVEGIAVDTHVIRLSKKLGLTNETDPEKIEKDLMELIPRKDWLSFNYRLITYGRNICVARKHKHEECPLTNVLEK